MKWLSVALILAAIGAMAQAKADLVTSERQPMQCTPSSCIDPRTGDFTQSHCDQFGCRPLGGVVGRLSPRAKRQQLRRTQNHGRSSETSDSAVG